MPLQPILVPVTGLYAGLLGGIMIVLAALVIRQRMRLGASLGADAFPSLLEAVRRHANFIEWVPFILMLMAIAELNGLPRTGLHAAGGITLAARLLHPLGVRHDRIPQPLRFAGAFMTIMVTSVLCAVVVWQAIRAL
jgi:uncharacterized membrane protein YecN with MAPEG domain